MRDTNFIAHPEGFDSAGPQSLGSGGFSLWRRRSLIRPLISSWWFGAWLRCLAKGPWTGDWNKENISPAPVLSRARGGQGDTGPGGDKGTRARRLRARCRAVQGMEGGPGMSPHSPSLPGQVPSANQSEEDNWSKSGSLMFLCLKLKAQQHETT